MIKIKDIDYPAILKNFIMAGDKNKFIEWYKSNHNNEMPDMGDGECDWFVWTFFDNKDIVFASNLSQYENEEEELIKGKKRRLIEYAENAVITLWAEVKYGGKK